MPLVKSATAIGKKQTSMPGPKSAAYKNIVAARKLAAKTPAPKSNKKRSKQTAAYSTIGSRQRALERVKRTIWLHLDDINAGIIRLATAGNYMAARALFDIAGVYSLPPLDDEPKALAPASTASSATAPATPSASPSTLNPVDAFFKSIGIEPPCDEPAPDLAA